MSNKKAYYARDTYYNENHEIYFAETNLQARKWFSNEHNNGELGGIKVTRMPWADKHADKGYVPKTELFDNGWWHECWGCGREISEGEADEYLYYRENSDDNFEEGYGEINPVDKGQAIFCNDNCMKHHDKREALKKQVEDTCYKMMCRALKEKLPDAKPRSNTGDFLKDFHAHIETHDDGSFKVKQCRLHFSTPVTKYPCTIQLKEQEYRGDSLYDGVETLCANYDGEAMKKWVAEQKEKRNA